MTGNVRNVGNVGNVRKTLHAEANFFTKKSPDANVRALQKEAWQ